MYELIKQLCKEKGLSITKLSEMVTESSGNLSTWKKGYMRSDYLSKVADILEVSVDYLLGRTDSPSNNINNKNGVKSINVNGSVGNNSINNNYAELDKHDRELLEEYNKLSLKNKAKVINLITELEENDG